MTTTTNLNQVPYDFDQEQYNKLLQQVADLLMEERARYNRALSQTS